ncbi:MAG TPA: hypothetical protein VJV78_22030 [Polyangiales bacterium]|nr:hypothetical protein [Polyangiales bacterium]
MACLCFLAGCGGAETVEGDGSVGDSVPDTVVDECKAQSEASLDGLPLDLACTGLFADGGSDKTADGVYAFAPAFPLWSDNAGKKRWIKLPAGQKIDSSDQSRWRFPLGTKFWKQFDANGARVETRIFQKVRADRWVSTTYIWDAEGKHAMREDLGRELVRNGVNYRVPAKSLCDDCHEGHPDNVLGFEAVSLGMPGADQNGLTLQKLVAQNLLTNPPARTQLAIGDDGTGKAADVLGWLHINCGVSCHNDGVNSDAEKTGLRMKLDPTMLDGRASNTFPTFRLLINTPAVTMQWNKQMRVVPGMPDRSLLYKLITTRTAMDSTDQMPPLATRKADDKNVAKVREWILALPRK